MTPVRIGSLFAGIGGLELGLEVALDAETVWQVEIDPFCRGVLARHWPNTKRFDDVREVGKSNLAPVDIICGGFPCQDVSLAGKGAGLEGARSGLWFEYARIVEEMRPAFVVVENVPGLIRRGLDRVVSRLHGLGYTVEGTRMRAEDLGAPHRRERLFLIAYTERQQLRDEPRRLRGARGKRAAVSSDDGEAGPLADADGQRELQKERSLGSIGGRPRYGGRSMAHADGPGLEVGREQPARDERTPAQRSCPPLDSWAVEPDVGRVAHGIPSRVDRLKALGNAVVPQCAYIVGRRIAQIAGML